MFLKLCKHELKCSYRNFLFLYAILLIVSLCFNPNGNNMLSTFAMFLYIIIIIVLFVMCIVVIIRNYNNSMFSRNAYLTHTLPVSTTELLLTKILSAALWSVISIFVVFISFILMVLRINGFDFSVLADGMNEFFRLPYSMDIAMFLLYSLFSLLNTVTLIYLVMNITHTTHIQRFRPAIAFALYLLIGWVVSFIINIVSDFFHLSNLAIFSLNANLIMANTNTIAINNTSYILIMLIISVVLTIIYFFASKYILDHKLEIE